MFKQLLLDEFDDAALQSLDLRRGLEVWLDCALDLKKVDGHASIYWSYIRSFDGAILSLARTYTDPRKLRMALRPYFAHWHLQYVALLRVFQAFGYQFKSFNDYKLGDEAERYCFMRFDIHVRDLPGMYGFWDINSAFGVPATYYLHWDYGQYERDAATDFLNLAKFNDIKLGLHLSPFDSWLMNSRFDGNEDGCFRWLLSTAGKDYLNDLVSNERLWSDILTKTQQELVRLCASFKKSFPKGSGFAAHGGALIQSLYRTIPENPALARFSDELVAEKFLTEGRVQKLGLGRDCERLANETGMFKLTDVGGAVSADQFISNIIEAVSSGRAVSFLTHPQTLQIRLFSDDLTACLASKLTDIEKEGMAHFVKAPSQPVALSADLSLRLGTAHKGEHQLYRYEASQTLARISRTKPSIFSKAVAKQGGTRAYYVFEPIKLPLSGGQFYRISVESYRGENTLSCKLWVSAHDQDESRAPFLYRGIISSKISQFEFFQRSAAVELRIMIEVNGEGWAEFDPTLKIETITKPAGWSDRSLIAPPICGCCSQLADKTLGRS